MKKNIRNVTAICMAFFILLTFVAGCGKEENPVVQSGAVSPDEEEESETLNLNYPVRNKKQVVNGLLFCLQKSYEITIYNLFFM